MIHTPDLINGLFEGWGGVAIWGNVRRISRDRCTRGVSLKSTAFFTSWGFWNLFYYPHLAQWLSFTGGLFIVAGNTVWIALAWRYRNV
jgi:hypothetical protein